jgi:hypothetical protein
MTDEYIIIRHVSGEDIIGRVVYKDKDIITIDDAMIMRVGYTTDNSTPYLYLFKYMLYDSSYSVTFKQLQIISTHIPMKQVIDYHNTVVKKTKTKKQFYTSQDGFDEDMIKAIMEKITNKNTLQ